MSLSRLADVASFKTGKLNSNAAVEGGAYPFFTCAQETYRIDKPAFDTKAVLLAGNNANGIYPLKYYEGEFNAYQRTYVVETLNEEVLDTRFLYYALRPALAQFQAASIGAATQYLTKSILDNFKIAVPGIERQRQVASVLSAYDDLIENNRQRIALLEEVARQLYKEWFVRFRFPGHEHVPFVNGVPEGWSVTTMQDMAETVGGGTPSTKKPEFWSDADITWFSPTDLTNNNSLVLLDSAKKINERGLAGSSAKMLPPETILMSSRASVGFFGLYDGEACTNQGFISLIPKAKNTRMYLLFNLIHRKEEIVGLASGATYKEINKSTFRAMPISLPSDALLSEFEDLTYQNIKQVRLLMKSNAGLKRARDLLLPKLMSGEIAV